jgi:hypothetical protein
MYAADVLSAGDTLKIIGTLTNPNYVANYQYRDSSDAALWLSDGTFCIIHTYVYHYGEYLFILLSSVS